MARIGKGILSGFSGSVGNVTGARTFEQDVIRRKRNKTNPTVSLKQEETRRAMAIAHQLWKIIMQRSVYENISEPKGPRSKFNQFAAYFLKLYFHEARLLVPGIPFYTTDTHEVGEFELIDFGTLVANNLKWFNNPMPRGASNLDRHYSFTLRIGESVQINFQDSSTQRRGSTVFQSGTNVQKSNTFNLIRLAGFFNEDTGYFGNVFGFINRPPYV